MIVQTAQFLERKFMLPEERTVRVLRRVVVALAATLFVLIATLLVALEDIFPGQTSVESLSVGSVAPVDIRAPAAKTYISEVLTRQARQAARENVNTVYDPPDPSVARIQTQLARQILDFIDNVRRDPYATIEQKINDINQITALTLDPEISTYILQVSDETWKDIDDQIVNVLERVMRESIRDVDLSANIDQLPTQVSVRFGTEDAAVIVAIVEDLIRPNRFENPLATSDAQAAAAAAVEPVQRSFETGQLVVKGGDLIDDLNYEALTNLDVLKPFDRRFGAITGALLASIIVMVVIGLYTARFNPTLLYDDPRMLTLLAIIFLITLAGARLVGNGGQMYIYPAGALALLFVTIIGPEIAIIGTLGLALLIGIMVGDSLEIATLVGIGGLIGTLTLRRAERVNSYFFAGLLIAMVNMVVIAIFNIGTPIANQTTDPITLVFYGLLNGMFSAAVALAGMYIVTLFFNLPTGLKLIELSQPNQPLLQRLLREAPGTYQHSLQVGNLAEQATNAIGGNAELVRVAALYHDIGKMPNAAFFTENQRDIGNPHDLINDPYRSADIIISHVTEGAEMARQYRLPKRLRDFILEHHGTTQVYVFYRQAVVNAGGDESAVDIADFTYPGPNPRSRETAVMMLADSCEAAVRSSQPKNKKEIEDIVYGIIDSKRKAGQLDESGLTLNDLNVIQRIFVDMLKAVFHPRINYATAVSGMPKTDVPTKTNIPAVVKPKSESKTNTQEGAVVTNGVDKKPKTEPKRITEEVVADPKPLAPKLRTGEQKVVSIVDDEAPLPDVPPLPRASDQRDGSANNRTKLEGTNGKKTTQDVEVDAEKE